MILSLIPMKKHLNCLLKITCILGLSVSLSACFLKPYRFTVLQGNVLCSDTLAELQLGMSQAEVHYLLGTPVLQDVFHENRWDYVYMEKPGYCPTEQYHVAVFFDAGKVVDIKWLSVPAAA